MAHFTLADEGFIEDEHGDVSYDEAIDAVVREALANIEMTIWELVDDLEYLVSAETVEPTDPADEE